MSNPTAFCSSLLSKTALLFLFFMVSSYPEAVAQTKPSNFIFLLAAGSLCTLDDSSACPAVAKSNAGDSYELTGSGTFDPQSKSAKAAGTYSHKSPNGNVLGTGVWLANELVSFDSYGAAPASFPNKGLAFGSGAMRPKRMPVVQGPMPTGGLAVFRIQLLPTHGPSRSATLQVNCALRDVPPERSVEGIRLTLEKNGPEFSEEVSGRVMFLPMPPEVSTPAKTPLREAPTSPVTPSN